MMAAADALNAFASSNPQHALARAKNAGAAKTIGAERSGLTPNAPGIP